PLMNNINIPKFSKDNYVFAYGNHLDGGSVYYININGKNNSVHGQSFHAYSADPPSGIIYGYREDISEYAFQLYNFETDTDLILENIPVDSSRTDYTFSILNDEIFVLFSSPNKLYIYDMKTGELKKQLEIDKNILTANEIVNDGTDKGIYVFSNNKTLYHISLENGKILQSVSVEIPDEGIYLYEIELFNEIIILSYRKGILKPCWIIDAERFKILAEIPEYYSYEPKAKKIYTCNSEHSNIGYVKVDEKIK
ncbi:MAG: hypothetical protein IKL31_02590, partial [Ruminococcus sp.]|nr:hypothetical protein [Ruminococcus sp.]